jgi:hypothetical protein
VGKSAKQKLQVNEYRLSVHFGFSGRAHALRAVYVDDKTAWSGRQATQQALSVNAPNAFGGPKEQGGLLGTIEYLPGGAAQTLPNRLAQRLGLTSSTSPAYRNITSLWFTGNESSQILGDYGYGYGIDVPEYDTSYTYSASTGSGFTWSANNPVIAQSVDAVLEYCPSSDEFSELNPAHAQIANADAPEGWPDANPAHIIYAVSVDPAYGASTDLSLVDHGSFRACAATLHAEGFGLSLIRTSPEATDQFISDILGHINGSVFTHPLTGLLTMRLYRDDYDSAALTALTPANARLLKAARTQGAQLGNQVTVKYTNPQNEADASVTRQTLAGIDAQNGISAADRNFYGIRKAALAEAVCERELRQVSTPLLVGEVEIIDPALHGDCFPGAVFRLAFPRRGLDGIVIRLLEVQQATLKSPKVIAKFSEDIFSVRKSPIYSPPPPSQWVRPEALPEAATAVVTMNTPYFWDVEDGVSPEWPAGYPFFVAGAPNRDAVDYDLVTYAAATGWRSRGLKSFVDYRVTDFALTASANSIAKSFWTDPVTCPAVGAFLLMGSGSDLGTEIAYVYDSTDTHWLLYRGVLDTAPRAHSSGVGVWCVLQPSRHVDQQEERASGEVANYRLLVRTSKGQLALASAPNLALTCTDRTHKPLRPANATLAGSLPSATITGATGTVTLNWANRNRLMEQGTVVPWSAGSVTPEYKQRTIVDVLTPAGVVIYRNDTLWSETSFVLDRAWFAKQSSVTVRLYSERDGLESLIKHTWTLSGLSNNPAAANPPSVGSPAVAPSPTGAPSAADFATSAGTTSTRQVPTIAVTGVIPVSDVTDVLIRYTPAGGVASTVPVPVNTEYAGTARPFSYTVGGCQPLTTYAISVAYVRDGVASAYTALTGVTTLDVIAGDSVTIGGVTGASLVASAAAATAAAAAASSAAAAASSAASSASSAAAAAQSTANDAQGKANDLISGVRAAYKSDRLGTLTQSSITADFATVNTNITALDAAKASNTSVTALATRVTNAEAVNATQASTLVTLTNGLATKAESSTVSTLSATVAANESTNTTFRNAQATTNSSTASTITTLTTRVADTEATNVTQASTLVTLTNGLATKAESSTVSTLSATVAANESTNTTFRNAQSTTNSSTASSLSSLTSRMTDAEATNTSQASTLVTLTDGLATKAEASTVSTLSATVAANESTNTTFRNAQSTTNSTTASSLSSLTSRMTDAEATNTSQASTLVTLTDGLATKAEASTVSTLSATVASNSSRLSSVESVNTTQTSSISALSTTLTAVQSSGSTVSLPSTFEKDDLYWARSGGSFVDVAGVGRCFQSGASTDSVTCKSRLAVRPNRTYRTTARFRVATNSSNGNPIQTLTGVLIRDSAGVYSGGWWVGSFATRTTSDGWVTVSGTFTTANVLSQNAAGVTIESFCQPSWQYSNGVVQVQYVLTEDVTDLVTVDASVAINAAAITTLAGAAATFSVRTAASGSNPAVFDLYAGPGGSLMNLGADRIFWGDSTVFVDSDDTMRGLYSVSGVLNVRVVAFGPQFGASSNLIEWNGLASVLGVTTRAGLSTASLAALTIANSSYCRTPDKVYSGGQLIDPNAPSGAIRGIQDIVDGLSSASAYADLVSVTLTGCPAGYTDFAKTNYIPFMSGTASASTWQFRYVLDGTPVPGCESPVFSGTDGAGSLTTDWFDTLTVFLKETVFSVGSGTRTIKIQSRRVSGLGTITAGGGVLDVTVIKS